MPLASSGNRRSCRPTRGAKRGGRSPFGRLCSDRFDAPSHTRLLWLRAVGDDLTGNRVDSVMTLLAIQRPVVGCKILALCRCEAARSGELTDRVVDFIRSRRDAFRRRECRYMRFERMMRALHGSCRSSRLWHRALWLLWSLG